MQSQLEGTENRIAVARNIHVAHNVTAARNGPALEFFRLRVEAHNGVRFGKRLAVPDGALRESHAVGLRLRAARRRPFLMRPAGKIEPAEKAARKIRVPDDVVGREREPPRSRPRIRKPVFLDRHGGGIDRPDLVAAKLDEDRNTLGIDQQPVGARIRSG